MTDQFRIIDVLPHDQPMCLLDDIESHSETGLIASVTPSSDSVFAEELGVPSWVGIEYMAQAVGAYAGVCSREHQEPVKVGFLVSARRYEPSCSYFPLGVKLHVIVERIMDNVTGLRVFDCQIKAEGISVRANLNVFMPDDVDAFLKENS